MLKCGAVSLGVLLLMRGRGLPFIGGEEEALWKIHSPLMESSKPPSY
jgi:hypothetical protein